MATVTYPIYYKENYNCQMTEHFIIFEITEDASVSDFIDSQGLLLKKEANFCQISSPTRIKANRKIVLIDRLTNELFEQEEAINLLGLTFGENVKVTTTILERFDVFAQNLSSKTTLFSGTKFVYELDTYYRNLIVETQRAFVKYAKEEICSKHNPLFIDIRDFLGFYQTIKSREDGANDFIRSAEAFPKNINEDYEIWTIDFDDGLYATGYIFFSVDINYKDGKLDFGFEIC